MKDPRAYYRIVGERLERLKPLLSDADRRRYFEESLAANELEIALHALCNYLLEPGTPSVSRAALNEIESLHAQMEIEDDCARRLAEKGQGGEMVSGTIS
jgi:hypothetical protein